MRPGVTRDIKFEGYIFKQLPIYERGGIPIKSFFLSYKQGTHQGLRVGRALFFDIMKILTKHGESKSGLSTYYISIRHALSIFVKMMKRVSLINSQKKLKILILKTK